MPISRRRAAEGSSSTTMTMFFIAPRKRPGMEASASATRCSNAFRCTGFSRRLFRARRAAGLRAAAALADDDGAVVVALVAHRALIAQRPGPADAPAMEDQRVRRAR